MSDFIVLKCENCGASLEVSKEKETFYCQFCGYKHILRNNSKGNSVDESYAACPLCKRNDKTQRVTSLTKFNEFDLLKDELIKAKKPWPSFVEPDLSIPEPMINGLFYLFAVVAGFILLFLFSGLALGPNEEIGFNIFIIFLMLIPATALYFSVKKIIANKKISREKIFSMKSISDEKKVLWEQRKQEFENMREIIIDNLYYCSRDDIAFEKSLREYTNINNLSNYIKKLVYEQVEFEPLEGEFENEP